MDKERSNEGSYERHVSGHKSDLVVEVRPIRKRTWMPAEKLSIVREGLQRGAVAADIMRHHGISSSVFYTWRKQVLAAAPAGFMPVRVAEPPPTQDRAPQVASRIEIITPGGTTLRIEGAVDARTLGAVLKALCA
ncbi:MAG: transposase [Micropepsaceae bacterium]